MTAGGVRDEPTSVRSARRSSLRTASACSESPIGARDEFAAGRRSAAVAHRFRVGAEHGVIDRQLFADLDVPHRDEDDLPLDPDVGLAGMIQKHHDAFRLALRERAQHKPVRNRVAPIARREAMLLQHGPRKDVATPHGDDLALRDALRREQPAAMSLAAQDPGLRRPIGGYAQSHGFFLPCRSSDFAMVHDSFGVHASDIDLNRVLREEFVRINRSCRTF